MSGSTVATLLGAIGDTPLVEIPLGPGHARLLVKVEGGNPTGSYKDRMAVAMVSEAEKRGDLRPGMTVVEYTGGSTGSSLAFVCAAKGYRFRVVTSDAFSRAKRDMMSAFGAEVTVIPSRGGITGPLIEAMMAKAADYAAEADAYATDQFQNRDMLTGYRGMGQELVGQVPGGIDLLCAGVGTAGMLMGVGAELVQHGTRIVALEPAESPLLSTGSGGSHRVEGIGVGFRPPLLDDAILDDVRAIGQDDAREAARRMAAEHGILAGWSSGLNVAAAVQFARELGPGHTVVTVTVDTGLKYLDTGLYA